MHAKKERVAYFNGEYLPESEVRIPFRDRGFLLGDAVFDTARTFNGRVFKLREHIERLFRSLKHAAIDPGLTPNDLFAISEQVIERNLDLLTENEDYWVTQRVTRGLNVVGGELHESAGATVIVECTPLPLRARAPLFQQGIDVVLPSLRRIPPDCLSPNVKSHNYLNLVLADNEVRSCSDNPNLWAVLLDTRGFLSEGIGSNIFLVKDGTLLTPKGQYVLAGISRETVIELARNIDIPVVEDDLSLYDAHSAQEAFITSTSFCLCPVRSVAGQPMGDAAIPGPLTRKLTEAFAELVSFDFVGQYLAFLK